MQGNSFSIQRHDMDGLVVDLFIKKHFRFLLRADSQYASHLKDRIKFSINTTTLKCKNTVGWLCYRTWAFRIERNNDYYYQIEKNRKAFTKKPIKLATLERPVCFTHCTKPSKSVNLVCFCCVPFFYLRSGQALVALHCFDR